MKTIVAVSSDTFASFRGVRYRIVAAEYDRERNWAHVSVEPQSATVVSMICSRMLRDGGLRREVFRDIDLDAQPAT